MNLRDASWWDFQQAHGGGAKNFAAQVFGIELGEFMQRFGRADRSLPPVPPPPRPPSRSGVGALWEALLEQPRERAADWIERVRGVPAELVDSGFAYVDDAVIDVFPADLHRWLHRHVATNGPSVAVPLRDPAGDVVNIHLRPIRGSERRFLPKALLSTGRGPAAYGFPRAALSATLTVVCEGAVDTMFAEAAVRDHVDVVAVGAASSSTMPAWGEWLSRKPRGDVVVVPHVDDNGAGQKGAARLVTLLERCDISCRMFSWDRFYRAVGSVVPRDLGDALKVVPFARARDAFLEAVAA